MGSPPAARGAFQPEPSNRFGRPYLRTIRPAPLPSSLMNKRLLTPFSLPFLSPDPFLSDPFLSQLPDRFEQRGDILIVRFDWSLQLSG